MELREALYEAGDDGVATITLNRPEQRNPLGPQMVADLTAALQHAGDDPAVRAVVLTGAGEKAFCAGADLSSFAADATELDRHLGRGAFVEMFVACERLGKPLIGCINGHALAGGFGLALCCDLLVCADTATFGTPEIKVGVWPMMIMSIVTRNLGRKRAMELFMTGRRIDAATALEWGFVNRVVTPGEVRERAHALATEIAGWSPLIMHLGRDAFYATDSLDFESALRYLQAQLTVVSMTEDFREGVTAFLGEARTELPRPLMAGEGTLADRSADLQERRGRARGMGGPDAIAKQHGRNKLTARERIELLFDAGTFVEFGLLAHQHSLHVAETDPARTPADGVVTGEGLVDGRRVYCAAYDFTVMAGSMGMIGEQKVARLRAKALLNRLPMIWLLDSAGARIQEAAGSTFAGSGALFYEQVQMSGVVPQVAAMLGPCAAGTAYIPGLADFVPMVRETSSMSLGGARLVRAATGEETTDHDMGGSQVHCYVSGVGDLEVDDDAACIGAVREFLSFLPSHNRDDPPRRPSTDPRDRRVDDFPKLVPLSARAAYDVRKVIKRLVDDGHVFEVKPTWARNIVTALARFDGRSCGIVASQPMHKGGALDIDAADKAARFITLCDAFNIPLLFLMDVPGFIVGTEVERQGIIRHGAKMLYAVSEATVPKVTVVLRKAYGAGYYVMCGRGYEPDTLVAWPGAEISVMGPEGAVDIIFAKQVAAAEDPKAERAKLVETVRATIDPYVAAGWAMIDDIIEPAETRLVICDALDAAATKHRERAWRKHGVPPV